VVYELPEFTGRGGLLSGLEESLKRNFPRAEVINAGGLPDDALREKLQGPFLLISSLDERARILRLAAKPLPLRIDEASLVWRDITVPVKEAMIFFIGKNPYGSGYCMVMAAGNPELLSAMDAGRSTYLLAQGKAVVERGNYGADFVVRDPNRISIADAKADAAQFFSTLERMHPNLNASVSAAEYELLKRQTTSDVQAMAKDGLVRIRDLAWVLRYAAGRFHEGHLMVQWRVEPDAYAARETRFPPFWLDAENGRYRITASTLAELTGMELTGVNGKSVDEFAGPILDRCAGETMAFRATGFTASQAFWFWFSDVLGQAASCRIKVRSRDGVETEHTLETLRFAEYQKLKPAVGARQTGPQTAGGTRVEFFDGGKIARLIYPSFRFGDGEKKQIDEVFRRIREARSESLLIDLRGNGGGDSRMGDYLFHYFHEGALEQERGARVRVSRELFDAMKQGGIEVPAEAGRLLEVYEGKTVAAGELEKMAGYAEAVLPKPENFFTGRVVLLTSNYTFSSAAMFAGAFRDYGLGTIVGLETGGVPAHFGQAPTMRLAHSGIGFQAPTAQYFPVKPRDGDDRRGVLPDIAITEKMWAAYGGELDPVLAAALAEVRGK
jgi:hypothetical protein